MQVNTYLFFDGCCEQAIEYYRGALGAQVDFLMRYKEGPAQLIRPGGQDKIFHATLRIGDTRFNACDDLTGEAGRFDGFALLVHVDGQARADRLFAQLAQGGQVKMALTRTPWSPCYGIVRDRFGVLWKVQAAD